MASKHVDVQSEISYSMAWSMLVAMMRQGKLSKDEFNAIHHKIIRKYHPTAVRRLA
jgi:hypothetical protein